MTDASTEAGWWQASDGKWYPPETPRDAPDQPQTNGTEAPSPPARARKTPTLSDLANHGGRPSTPEPPRRTPTLRDLSGLADRGRPALGKPVDPADHEGHSAPPPEAPTVDQPAATDMEDPPASRWGPSVTEVAGVTEVIPPRTPRHAASGANGKPTPPARRARGARHAGDRGQPSALATTIVVVVIVGVAVWLGLLVAGIGNGPAKHSAAPPTVHHRLIGSTTTVPHARVTTPKATQYPLGVSVSVGNGSGAALADAAVRSYFLDTRATNGRVADPGQQFAATEIRVCAGTNGAPRGVSVSGFELVLPNGRTLPPVTGAPLGNPDLSQPVPLKPNACVDGYLSFEIPKGTSPTAVLYSNGTSPPVEWLLGQNG